MCVDMRDEYSDCGVNVIVKHRDALCIIFALAVRGTPVWWSHKVQISEVMVVMGLTPSELTQCLIPPSELVNGRVQLLFIVELIQM